MKSSIASKLAIFSIILVTGATSLIGAVFYYEGSEYLSKQKFRSVAKEAGHLAPYLLNGLNELSNDVGYISELPSIKKLLKTDKENTEKIIEDEAYPFFKTLMSSKPNYLHIKVINTRSKKLELEFTDEIIRKIEEKKRDMEGVKLIKRKGKEEELQKEEFVQYKFDYDKYTMNRVYLSPIRLLRENEKVSGKKIPTIDAVKPILDSEKKIIGLLIITANLRNDFKNLKSELANKNADLYLTNDRGDYLIHPERKKTFGFDLGKRVFIQDEFLKTGNLFTSKKKSITVDPGVFKSEQLLHLAKVHFDKNEPNRYLALGIKINYDEALAEFKAIRVRSFLYTILLLACAGIAAFIFSKKITRNLNKITIAAQEFAEGKQGLDLLVRSNDEIAVLAKTFLNMIRLINDRTKWLKKSEENQRRSRAYAEEVSKTKTILLRNTKRQKNEIERMVQEKDDLMAVVSHDLKNPLAVIEASMKMLLAEKDKAPPDLMRDLHARSLRAAQFALNLITDLLDLARLEGGMNLTYEVFSFNKLLQTSIDAHTLKIEEKHIKIITDVKTDLKVNADFGRFSQVVNNILGNALKFTPEKGSITFSVREIKATTKKKEPTVHLSISDTGIGIPQEKIARIFDKYEQARDKDREIGTGLGLAICKNIVELHNGEIWVESEEGRGTTFHIIIPTAMADAAIEKTQQIQAKKNVLIVDDTVDILNLIGRQLKSHGFKVSTAENGLKAIQSIKQTRPDIVLLDIEMPVMDGLETLAKIRQFFNSKSLPVIMHSSKITPDTIESFSQHANDYIQKPAEISELLNKIQEQLYKGTQKIKIMNGEEIPANVLLVDDSEDIRTIVNLYLKSKGHRLDYAENGKIALDKVSNNLYDIIFMDMNMPVMDGFEATKQIRIMEKKMGREPVSIVAMSGNSGDDYKTKCLKAGCTVVSDKKIDKEKLFSLIDNYRI